MGKQGALCVPSVLHGVVSTAGDASLTKSNLTPFVLGSHSPHGASWILLVSHKVD